MEQTTTGAVRIRVARPTPTEDRALQLLHGNEDGTAHMFLFGSQALLGMAAVSALIFWCSAAVGLWAAYDRVSALGRFALLSMGLLLVGLVYWSTRRSPTQAAEEPSAQKPGRVERVLLTFTAIGLDAGLLAGGIGLLFLLTHNWQLASEQDFTLLPWLTAWIQTQQPFGRSGLLLHENLVAGALLVLLPPAIVTLWGTMDRATALYRWCAGAGTAIGMVALLLTFSRGAWLGLLVGTGVAGYLHWRTAGDRQRRWARQATVAQQRRSRPGTRTQQSMFRQRFTRGRLPWGDRLSSQVALVDWLMGILVVMGLGFFVSITVSPLLHDLLLRPMAGTYLEMNINSRIAVWQDVLPLIQDYPYTGSGLGSTPLVLASYVYLLHVPYLNHAHNLYLQVAVEQGLPGLIGLLGMIISAGGLGWLWLRHGNRAERRLATGALTPLVALLVYGCTDAELYVGIFVPLLFLPFALLIACAPWVERTELSTCVTQPQAAAHTEWVTGKWPVGTGLVVPVLAVLALCLWPGSQTGWQLNQATVAQTRQELALYDWPTWPIQDALRRSDRIDTASWVAEYEAVLQADAENVAAARRLGQILLSQGDYGRAAMLLTTAYRQAPHQRATRQLLGEVKALLGNQPEATALWQTVDISQGQLDLRLWWYEHVGNGAEVQRFAQVLDQAMSVEQVTERSGGTTDD